MTERHIGIESELRIKNDMTGEQNVPRNVEYSLNEQGLLQSIGYDGGGREFRTNPISVKSILKQVRGRKYLTRYYDILSESTEVSERGGTHIHISILDKDHVNMESNATALAMAFFSQFQKIAGRSSHWASRFHIDGVGNTDITKLREYLDRSRYICSRAYSHKGSMLNPTGHQTLEFRGGVGTNDIKDILAWIDFLNNVVKTSNRESVDGVKFGDLLKGETISEYVKGLKGWRKLSKRDLNKVVNVNALTA